MIGGLDSKGERRKVCRRKGKVVSILNSVKLHRIQIQIQSFMCKNICKHRAK